MPKTSGIYYINKLYLPEGGMRFEIWLTTETEPIFVDTLEDFVKKRKPG